LGFQTKSEGFIILSKNPKEYFYFLF